MQSAGPSSINRSISPSISISSSTDFPIECPSISSSESQTSRPTSPITKEDGPKYGKKGSYKYWPSGESGWSSFANEPELQEQEWQATNNKEQEFQSSNVQQKPVTSNSKTKNLIARRFWPNNFVSDKFAPTNVLNFDHNFYGIGVIVERKMESNPPLHLNNIDTDKYTHWKYSIYPFSSGQDQPSEIILYRSVHTKWDIGQWINFSLSELKGNVFKKAPKVVKEHSPQFITMPFLNKITVQCKIVIPKKYPVNKNVRTYRYIPGADGKRVPFIQQITDDLNLIEPKHHGYALIGTLEYERKHNSNRSTLGEWHLVNIRPKFFDFEEKNTE